MKVAALLVALWLCGAGSAQQQLRAALDRNPATLPRAEAGRWKTFDPQALQPTDLPARYYAARVALERAEPIAALAELYALLDEQPGWPPALHQCAVLHFRLQRYGDAVTCAQRFLDECPARVRETRVLGHALYSLGRYEEARTHYERVLAANPKDVEARRGLALSYARLGNAARALELLQQVVEARPNHPEAWTWIARLAYEAEDLARARQAAQRATECDPYDPAPRFVLAQTLAELGEPEAAQTQRTRFEVLSQATARLRQLEAEEEFAPHDARLPEQRTRLWASLGATQRAQSAMRRWLTVAGDDAQAHLAALALVETLAAPELEGQIAARCEVLVGDSVAGWQQLEAYFGRRGDAGRQAVAGERWRRLQNGR